MEIVIVYRYKEVGIMIQHAVVELLTSIGDKY